MVISLERSIAERGEGNFEECRHHWLIGTASGPTSKGTCRLCGAEREFKNFIDGTDWDDGVPASGDSPRAVVASVAPVDEPGEEE